MKSKRLQGLVTAGRWTLPAAIFICTLCWVLTSALLPELTMTAGEEGGSVLWQSARTLLLPAWAEHLVSFLIYAAIGYFLIELNNRFSIIRMRASVQTAIYFLLVTVCPEMHLLYAGNVAAIAFLFSIYFLFKSYQQSQARSCLSVQGAFSFPSSPSSRCSGCLRRIAFSHLRSVVSVARW
jgi:uncharacterized membrane protein